MKFDLLYEENGWPWHYDRAGQRFKQPFGPQWTLIAERQSNEKLNIFTLCYVPLRMDLQKESRPNTVSDIVRLWEEFEICINQIGGFTK